MAKLELYTPVDPLHVNQEFGANPAYYAKFLDNYGVPEKGHMGRDLMASHGQPVYAAHDGTAFYIKDEHGGEGIHLISDQKYDYNSGSQYFLTIYWHMIGDTDSKFPAPIPMGGVKTKVKTGDLIGYADNTGAPFESSGDHLHFGLMPCDVNGYALNAANGYGGCIDPAPYMNGTFAGAIKVAQKAVEASQTVLNALPSLPVADQQKDLGILASLLVWIKNLLSPKP